MFDRQTSWFPAAGDACGTIRHMKKEKVGWNKGLPVSLALQKVKEMVKESSLQERGLQSFAVSIFPLLLADAQ